MRKQTVMKRRKGLNDTEVEGEAEGNRKKEGDDWIVYLCEFCDCIHMWTAFPNIKFFFCTRVKNPVSSQTASSL